MQRIFKFRAWHRDAEEMLTETYPGEVFAWAHLRQPLEIMEFTGLCDKNGKEIYSDDIIRISASNECCSLCSTFSCDCSEFDYCRTKKDHILKSVIFDFSFLPKLEALGPERSDVVGNRFENPELLEVERAKRD